MRFSVSISNDLLHYFYVSNPQFVYTCQALIHCLIQTMKIFLFCPTHLISSSSLNKTIFLQDYTMSYQELLAVSFCFEAHAFFSIIKVYHFSFDKLCLILAKLNKFYSLSCVVLPNARSLSCFVLYFIKVCYSIGNMSLFTSIRFFLFFQLFLRFL